MVDHMPVPHQRLLETVDTRAIRGHVTGSADPTMIDAYNAGLQRVLDFRSLNLKMARSYVASRLDDPTGTGGTEFMPWLTRMRPPRSPSVLALTQEPMGVGADVGGQSFSVDSTVVPNGTLKSAEVRAQLLSDVGTALLEIRVGFTLWEE